MLLVSLIKIYLWRFGSNRKICAKKNNTLFTTIPSTNRDVSITTSLR
jgi:hypothetical protein